MSRIGDLISQVAQLQPQLGKDLQKELSYLNNRRTFGLVFERHQPESVELPSLAVCKGSKVHILAPRGSKDARDNSRLWLVRGFDSTDVEDGRSARLIEVLPDGAIWNIETIGREPETRTELVSDLVVVAEFKDDIFPGLTEIGRVENGDKKDPYHAVINAENFHALQMLTYTHREAIDLIYIDPPYNTGGKFSWLYNDNYVDNTDAYKHSKWLGFMERRLKIARDLLKPSGAIMVSIGDDEQHRLRMLMDQIFGAEHLVTQLAVEMSTTSGPKTVNAQQGTIVKNVEYVLIYRKSKSFDIDVQHTPLYDSVKGWDKHYSLWLNEDGTVSSFYDKLVADPSVWRDVQTAGLVKKNGHFLGAQAMDKLLAFSDSANNFIEENLDQIVRLDTPPVSVKDVDVPVGRWVEVEADHRSYIVTRLKTGTINQMYTLRRNYRLPDENNPKLGRTIIRGDLWRGFHQDMGTVSYEGGVGFANGKKPVRLIRQLIKWANNSPDTVILDFFAGSGTTAHAVAEMNAEDGGNRRSILVTNNELSLTDHRSVQKKGLRPGDSEWEKFGVFISRTKPRIINMAERTSSNAAFFTLTYEQPALVQYGDAFERIAPLLWLRAGQTGEMITEVPEVGWDVVETYGVIVDTDTASDFVQALGAQNRAATAFIVTDDIDAFQRISRDLPHGVTSIRLYESYLSNFKINSGEL